MRKILAFSAVSFIIDRVLKEIITSVYSYGMSIEIIKNFFNLTIVKNTGAAFNLFSENTFLLILIAIFVLICIYMFFIRNQNLKNIEKISYGVLIGGIIGNLFDRIVYGFVIDYIHILSFPVFNFADGCICMSVIMILFKAGDKNGKQQ